jgi:UDP-N-acetylmuramyl tripeptide synthase
MRCALVRPRGCACAALRTDSRAVQPGRRPSSPGRARRWTAGASCRRRWQAGAAACLVEADGVEAFGFDDARIAALPGLKAATGAMADAFFGQPSRALDVVATTGTNGKTCTAWWTAQALTRWAGAAAWSARWASAAAHDAGRATGPDHARPGDAARRAAPLRRRGLRRLRDRGLVDRHRRAAPGGARIASRCSPTSRATTSTTTAAWPPTGPPSAAVRLAGPAAAVVNIDDEQGCRAGRRIARQAAGPVDRVGARAAARLRGAPAPTPTAAWPSTPSRATARAGAQRAWSASYNASNLLVVLAALRALGVPLADAAAVLPR